MDSINAINFMSPLSIHITSSSAKNVNNVCTPVSLTLLQSVDMFKVMTNCFAESKPV